ncbi:hypothetical protein OAM56_01810 [Alphaproteobacteria bacterium]|nr:hypothetical protein [Alphaproteobacteria bacterium]
MSFINYNKNLISSTVIFTSLQMLANLSNLVFFLLVSKHLTNADFALFGTLFALINTFGGIAGGIFTVVCRNITELSLSSVSAIKLKLKEYDKNLFLALIILTIIMFLSMNQLKIYLKIPSDYSILLSFVIIILVLAYSINFAVFQGLQFFFALGFLGFLVSFIKIPLFYFTPKVFLNANAALITVIISSVIVYLISRGSLAIIFKRVKIAEPRSEIYEKKFLITTIFSQIIFNLMLNIDILIVRYMFDAEIAGTYIVASSLAKIIIILSTTATTVLFPMLTAVFIKKIKNNNLTKITIFYNIFLILFFITTFWFLSSEISYLLYKDKYPNLDLYMKYLVFASSPLALLHLFEFIFISKKQIFVAYVFSISIPITIVYTIFYINDIFNFMLIYGLINIVTLSIVMFKFNIERGKLID